MTASFAEKPANCKFFLNDPQKKVDGPQIYDILKL